MVLKNRGSLLKINHRHHLITNCFEIVLFNYYLLQPHQSFDFHHHHHHHHRTGFLGATL